MTSTLRVPDADSTRPGTSGDRPAYMYVVYLDNYVVPSTEDAQVLYLKSDISGYDAGAPLRLRVRDEQYCIRLEFVLSAKVNIDDIKSSLIRRLVRDFGIVPGRSLRDYDDSVRVYWVPSSTEL